MDVDLSYFRAIHGATGCKNSKDIKTAEIQNRFARDFNSSINVVYDATRNDMPQDFIIVPSSKEIKIYTRPGETLNIGDIILWNKLHWLVIKKDFQDEIYNSGEIVQCNRIISWQNQTNKNIISRWCLATKPYTSNIDDGKVVSTSNREYKIQLPYDSETSIIDLDRRFLLEKIGGHAKAYKVTSVDTLTNRYEDIDGGFLIWNLTQTEFSAAHDNPDLMIADYLSPGFPTPSPTPNPTLLKCDIAGSPTIKNGGSNRLYKPLFYLADGITLDETVTPVWTVEVAPAYANKIISTANGNLISLKCADDNGMVGVDFKLKLSDSKGLYATSEIMVKVVSAF